MKREIYFDGNHVHTKDDFFEQMGKLFDLPSYYEPNLDSLWDCFISYINTDVRIFISNYENIKQVFGPERIGLEDIFERLPNYFPELELRIS